MKKKILTDHIHQPQTNTAISIRGICVKHGQNSCMYSAQASVCGQDLRIISMESKSRLLDRGPGLSASNRKPQLYLSDNTDTDTEQSIQCAL